MIDTQAENGAGKGLIILVQLRYPLNDVRK